MNGFHFKLGNALHRRVRIVPLFFFAFISLSVVAAVAAPNTFGSNVSTSPTAMGDWVQADFDAAHSGFNRLETQINPGNVGSLTQLWSSPVGTGALYASPVVWNGKVYIGSGDGRMYAFDAATGATLWVGPQQDLFFVDSAAVGHGLVFASSVYSTFLAYDAQTGAIAWTSPLTDVRASPTLRGGTLYVGSFDGRLVALDAKTGAPIWFARGNCCIFDQAPVVDGGRVFQMRTDGTLTAYDAQTGEQLWSKPEFSVGTLAAAHGTLFVNHYPNVVALDGATGEELWAAPVLTRAVSGAPAVANGVVFVMSHDTDGPSSRHWCSYLERCRLEQLGPVGGKRCSLRFSVWRRMGCVRRARWFTALVSHCRRWMRISVHQRSPGNCEWHALSRGARSIFARLCFADTSKSHRSCYRPREMRLAVVDTALL